jgi:membrane protein YqaA with SNARE-associated domain
LKGKAWLSILAVTTVATISALLLWQMIFHGGSLGRLGLAGLFVASLLSHLTVVARDMFIPMFLAMTPTHPPLHLGVAAGWGGAIGEVSAYFLGWGVAESIERDTRQAESRVSRWIRQYGLWAVLLVSITPLPDTPIVLIAGSGRLPLKRLVVVEGVGKMTYYTLGAFLGEFIFIGLRDTLGSLAASMFLVAASLVFCVLVTWGRSRDVIFGWVERLLP